MNEGDVILTPLPQADGRVKNRPGQSILGSIGAISPERYRRLLHRLSAYLVEKVG